MRAVGTLLAACVALGSSGCYMSAQSKIVAPDAAVPVSLSDGVRDADGKLLLPQDVQTVGRYDESFHAYSLIWSIIDLKPTTDLSSSINSAVASVHGDAVTQLTVTADQCWTHGLLFFWWIPLVPSCVSYHVQGNIVSARR